MTQKAQKAASTELTSGAGFTYEDTVVAYYLAKLLLEERAAGQTGIVKAVAVQQAGHGDPMDDVIVEFNDAGIQRKLSLQGKTSVTISAGNEQFRDIMTRAISRRAQPDFNSDLDLYGFFCEHITASSLRALQRIIDWAKSSPTGSDFAIRFADGGSAGKSEHKLRTALATLVGAKSEDEERNFYANFVALKLDGLLDSGALRTEVINQLQALVATNEDGQDILLFDRLCRIAREDAATARKWTRQILLTQLRCAVRLKVAPNYQDDLSILQTFSISGLTDISEEVAGFRIERSDIEQKIQERLTQFRVVNLSGLPGCGKSAMLKRIATVYAIKGPILFLKSDRLEGCSWLIFANKLSLKHRAIVDILAEVGGAGTPILFIDGIDRIRPNQQGILIDILRAIEENEHLVNWKVLATSRDQGLEAYRTWFPVNFYRQSAIGDVSVSAFNEEEAKALAEKIPNLRRLLFGAPAVREIARRPFFTAVLARNLPENTITLQTEVDLITAWWDRAGHDVPEENAPQRKRALLDLAERGAENLGKRIPAKYLKENTLQQIAGLKADFIIRTQDSDASYSFTHDIFFEWVFFRHLIDLGDKWTEGLIAAGEAPLLGRVIGLLAQRALATPSNWSAGYRALAGQNLRSQWRREWLTAAPFTPAFEQRKQEFQALLLENDYALFEKVLVWFQAQHTIPSPAILQNSTVTVDGIDRVRVAELLSWPSDFDGWKRFLDWLIPLAPSLPPKVLPQVLEVFEVWQNFAADIKNKHSEAIIEVCNNWLITLEETEYSDELSFDRDQWSALSRETCSNLATAFRTIILRSARSYPAPAIALFDRAVVNDRMRRETYSELMTFTPIMVDVSPAAVIAVTKAELIEELPQEKIDREKREQQKRMEFLKRLRAIPEKDRTEEEKRTLKSVFPPMSQSRYDLEDIGIDRHHSYYYPTSALHEPFASLFAKSSEAALSLVRDLANHATKGWYQNQLLNLQRMGTPIPITLEFPWGKQTFLGNWRVYGWFLGYEAPQPLECAFLALSYWAFKQIENGSPPDEVIQAIVKGNQCYAVLGLALVIALEVHEVSETTLPLVTCQLLWEHDLARAVQEPLRNVDLFGFGFLSHLTGTKAEAKEFLDSRESRKRNIQKFAGYFALSDNDTLRERFKEALARFPDDLPYEIEELRSNKDVNAELKEKAERWAGLGDIQNYRAKKTASDEVIVYYQPPKSRTPAEEECLAESTNSLQEMSVISWANKSLQQSQIAEGIKLEDAITFAKARDNPTIFEQRLDVSAHSPQTVVSVTAAVVIRLGPNNGPDYDWAWDVMDRVFVMKEIQGAFPGSKVSWHPANHLVVALCHDRRGSSPRKNTVRQLFDLTAHPMIEVEQLAFKALFMDSDEHVRWVAAQLVVDLSIYHHIVITDDGKRDNSANIKAHRESLVRALRSLEEKKVTPFTDIPSAWVKPLEQRGAHRPSRQAEWHDSDPAFNPQHAAKFFNLFPIEVWCQSATHKPMFMQLLKQLVTWTAEQLMPSWCDEKSLHKREHRRADLFEWNPVLGDLIARAAPFFDVEIVRKEFLAPFLTDDEEGLKVLAEFTDMTVIRHVIDATTIPANTLALLSDCAERTMRDPVFNSRGYRAGQIHGNDLPKLIKALLFVKVDKAPGAARFVNGDWSQIAVIVPIVTQLITKVGWSVFVMQNFMTLCERAGISYPLDAFSQQVNAILSSLANAKSSWAGTSLPARIAAIVQRLADANYPLQADQARELLKLLDALIDLGDRRSAALEQTQAFKEIQGGVR